MTGMFLQTYLLEKVRVVFHSAVERTYHVFYALLTGASPREVQMWGIRPPQEHALTSGPAGGAAAAAEGSPEKYAQLREGLSTLTLRAEEQEHLLALVAAIIHLRDVRSPAGLKLLAVCPRMCPTTFAMPLDRCVLNALNAARCRCGSSHWTTALREAAARSAQLLWLMP